MAKTILAVDDSASLRQMVAFTLKGAGYDVVEAGDGVDGLSKAKAKQVGILARVPLASGLLTGKFRRDTTFAADDHRHFNREGAAFNKGETLSGVPYDVGLEAVDRLRLLVPPGATLAQLALRWILMFDGVTCAIPGAKSPDQARENLAAAALPPLAPDVMRAVESVYSSLVREHVHASY